MMMVCVHVKCADVMGIVSRALCYSPSPVIPAHEVTFEQPSYSVSEFMGFVAIRLIASSNASFPYNVRVTSTDLTANSQ